MEPEENIENVARLAHGYCQWFGMDRAGWLGDGEKIVKERRDAPEKPAVDVEIDFVGRAQDRVRREVIEGCRCYATFWRSRHHLAYHRLAVGTNELLLRRSIVF